MQIFCSTYPGRDVDVLPWRYKMFEDRTPYPSFSEMHPNINTSLHAAPLFSEVPWRDRFYDYSGSLIIRLGAALKSRSSLSCQPINPVMTEG
jgi:hypothetical protein